jgi:long-chain acyl-CoA synthetase
LSEANTRRVEGAFGCRLLEAWGMTELGGTGTTHLVDGPRKMGSVGVALLGMEIRIVATDGSGRCLPDGEIGELQVRGPLTMREYLGQPAATAQALDADGWLHTGDVACRDQDGYLYIVDRLKDMIITGGFKIYPNELERVISEHAGVAMVAVGSIADEIKGELAKAYVVAMPGGMLDLNDVDRHCRKRLAAYKVPKAYQIVADLPKSSTGKVLRRRLRELDTQ